MQNPTPQVPEYELVAHISKAKGLNGQLVAHVLGELSVLYPGLEVWIVPPLLEGVRHTSITEVEVNKHKTGVLLSLDGVTDKTQAGTLAGRYLLAPAKKQDTGTSLLSQEEGEWDKRNVPLSHLPKETVSEMIFTDVTFGSLGALVDLKPGAAYDIWVIEGPYGHLEIPAVDAYVVSEDDTTIQLDLPAGFIEITSVASKGSVHAH